MRILVAFVLLSAATTITVPPASACHPDPSPSSLGNPLDGYYVIPNAGVGGCPHEATVCVEVWKETNGEPGLQRRGWNPDTAILVVCPLP